MSAAKALGHLEVWFVVGSQELYGPETLRQVDADAREVAGALDESLPVAVAAKPVLTSAESIRRVLLEANADDRCVGVIAWMHTFSPARAWIAGLGALQKPLLHLHTQFGRDLPWADIDMDFMNLHQSAHGDREFGYVLTRLGHRRKTVVGHWRDPRAVARVDSWVRAACGWHEAQRVRVARLGDNMRDVAVTEGDKVEAQIALGFATNGYGVGDLVERVAAVAGAEVDRLLAEIDERYDVAPELRADGDRRGLLADALRIEAGLRSFLADTGATAFTDTFEDLHGLAQLPGISAQRLMADGFGFAGEGDWKTAALVRIFKTMAAGLEGGTSFMEDYTYDLPEGDETVLGAHMLEICPSIAGGPVACEAHPLGIGGKADPVRLVFTAAPGPAGVRALVDLGDRLRFVANEVDVIDPPHALPKLSVARALWRPRPDLATAAEAWLTAGGSHHTVYTAALGLETVTDLAEITGLELLPIGAETRLRDFANEVRWNRAYYHLARGL
jgi:L-arabinose isomerase